MGEWQLSNGRGREGGGGSSSLNKQHIPRPFQKRGDGAGSVVGGRKGGEV